MRFALILLATVAFAQRNIPVENEFVRVLSVTDAPGRGKGAMHEHVMNRVMIYLDDGEQRITYQDGRVVNLKFKAGEALWSPGGGMHQSENIGNKPTRIVEIELKGQPKAFEPPPLDPVKAKLSGYHVEIDNPSVRVVRATIPPHGSVPRHEHPLNRVTVYLRPAKMKITADGQAPIETAMTEAEVRFAKPVIHQEQNLGDGQFEALMVELK